MEREAVKNIFPSARRVKILAKIWLNHSSHSNLCNSAIFQAFELKFFALSPIYHRVISHQPPHSPIHPPFTRHSPAIHPHACCDHPTHTHIYHSISLPTIFCHSISPPIIISHSISSPTIPHHNISPPIIIYHHSSFLDHWYDAEDPPKKVSAKLVNKWLR